MMKMPWNTYTKMASSSTIAKRKIEISLVAVLQQIKRKILKCIILCVPNIRDEKTLIINIHEYTHALLYYKYLGKK